jgi:ligand-binding sensor domain-containing protein/putative methionine-R-sulfoxide reductase with GAF domain
MRGRTLSSQSLLYIVVFTMIGVAQLARAQGKADLSNIQFYRLTTADGLSDNYINSLTLDKNGYLWLGTGDGINRFDGKTVEKYYVADHPALHTNYVRQVVCDDKNRLWIHTGEYQMTLVDENRRFHYLGLWHNGKRESTRRILETKSHGIVLFTKNKQLTLKHDVDLSQRDSLVLSDFDTISMANASKLFSYHYTSVEPAQQDKFIFTTADSIYYADYANLTISPGIACNACRALGVWRDGRPLIYNNDQSIIEAVDFTTGKRERMFADLQTTNGRRIHGYVNQVQALSDDLYMITARIAGVFLYKISTGELFNYRHDPADITTPVNNFPSVIEQDSNGWVFIAGTPNGLSYYNSRAIIGQQLVFQDKKGHIYDGVVHHIRRKDEDHYYIAADEHLITWNRKTNISTFHEVLLRNKKGDRIPGQTSYIGIDQYGHTWIDVHPVGLYVLDKNDNIIHDFHAERFEKPHPLSGSVTHLNMGPDGYMWIATQRGSCKVDPKTYAIELFDEGTFKDISQLYTSRIEFLGDYIHFCTSNRGLYSYHVPTGKMHHARKKDGMLSDNIFTINQDKFGNLYIGSIAGLQVCLTNGDTLSYTMQNGLLYHRVEALLLDKQNRMWFGNDVGIGCFNIADTTLKVFDERFGLSIQGFRLNAYYQDPSDELMWGTEQGMQYFYPDDLYNQKVQFRAMINRIESRDLNQYLTSSADFNLTPGNNFITFHFSTIDFSTHLWTFYQYKLEGLDKEWITVGDQNSVRYYPIPPGEYVFRVRASNDKKTWVEADNEVRIRLAAHLYDQFWFRSLLVLLTIGGLTFLYRKLNQKQKVRTEAIETESVINYFASQINRHKNTDDMLWDVAKNCISKLNLEECVIYMVNAAGDKLIQKAAYGPKNPTGKTILQPIEIEVGAGITGTVAATKRPEIVNNTEKDPRYIVDDVRRMAEMAVPIVIDGKLIGVIDSEHSRRNFFTQKHLSLLTTISILTANQYERIKAEEERQKAEIEVLQNKQKATESRLQSLRLQMNPHFLFNALNSIQQMILANEEMVATRYLSRFSKLLRSILIHSDKEMISLKEELDILKLYVELESVRFKEAFTYSIHCDEEIDVDEVKIPTLLIQPFVENAIWHGLMHKEGMRHLKISFTEQGDFVHCVVEDNGIGRQKAREMKLSTGQDKNHTSKGIAVSMERLKAMQKNGGAPGALEIQDLIDEQGHAQGTRIDIHLPILN